MSASVPSPGTGTASAVFLRYSDNLHGGLYSTASLFDTVTVRGKAPCTSSFRCLRVPCGRSDRWCFDRGILEHPFRPKQGPGLMVAADSRRSASHGQHHWSDVAQPLRRLSGCSVRTPADTFSVPPITGPHVWTRTQERVCHALQATFGREPTLRLSARSRFAPARRDTRRDHPYDWNTSAGWMCESVRFRRPIDLRASVPSPRAPAGPSQPRAVSGPFSMPAPVAPCRGGDHPS